MSLKGFRAQNHPQQIPQHGPSLFPDLEDPIDTLDDRGTDPTLFAMLDQRFHFTLDVAASEDNAKCANYFDRYTNGLTEEWAEQRVWCNPPYSNIRAWVEKAWSEWAEGCWRPELIVMLLPANRTEQSWWQDLVEPRRDRGGPFTVEFLAGRLRFVPGVVTEKGDRPPFGCCLLIWSADV